MTQQTLDTASQAGDRLSFTLFLALAAHALIVFGCTFSIEKSNNVAPTLNVTIATHNDKIEPKKADFLAQKNQQASGSLDEVKELTTDQKAQIADVNINKITPNPQQKKIIKTDSERKLVTGNNSTTQTLEQNTAQDRQTQNPQEGEEIQTPLTSTKAASLRAKLDKQRQTFAKQPRIRRLTSIATKASSDAKYLSSWTEKIEFIGNQHFPKDAVSKGIVGNLTMVVTLLPNGEIDSTEVISSSGHSLLDDAALQIVRLASPFEPFPNELKANTDKLEIIRTWRFEISGLSTSNNE